MPCRYGASPAQRLSTEFIEADIEMAFHLADMAQWERTMGHSQPAARMTADAEAVLADIGRRFTRLQPIEQEAFRLLIGELRRAIRGAAGDSSEPSPA